MLSFVNTLLTQGEAGGGGGGAAAAGAAGAGSGGGGSVGANFADDAFVMVHDDDRYAVVRNEQDAFGGTAVCPICDRLLRCRTLGHTAAASLKTHIKAKAKGGCHAHQGMNFTRGTWACPANGCGHTTRSEREAWQHMADEVDDAHMACKRPGTGERGRAAGTPTVIDEAQRALRMKRAAAISLMRRLYSAAKEGDAPRVLAALEAGANPNQGMDDGFTPLMTAAEAGHVNVVKVLTAYPTCDVDVKNVYGQTALSFAAQNGRFEIAQALVGMWCASCSTARPLEAFTPAEQEKAIGSGRCCGGCSSEETAAVAAAAAAPAAAGGGSAGSGAAAKKPRTTPHSKAKAEEAPLSPPLSPDEHMLADMGFPIEQCRFAWKASGNRLEQAIESLLSGKAAAGCEREASFFNSKRLKESKKLKEQAAKAKANEDAAAAAIAAASRAGRMMVFANPLTICAGSTAAELARAAGHLRLADMLADVSAGKQLEMIMAALKVRGRAAGTYDSVESRLRDLYTCCGLQAPPVVEDDEVDFGEFDVEEDQACIVCMDALADTAIKPCFHAHFCMGCATQCPTCPTCRVRSQGVQRIYM